MNNAIEQRKTNPIPAQFQAMIGKCYTLNASSLTYEIISVTRNKRNGFVEFALMQHGMGSTIREHAYKFASDILNGRYREIKKDAQNNRTLKTKRQSLTGRP